MIYKVVKQRLLLTLALFFSIGFIAVSTPPIHSAALSGDAFVAGNIIDDGIFYNASAMSPNDIQAFLNAKVPSCDTNGSQIYSGSMTRAEYSRSYGYYPPFTCLRDYVQDVSSITNSPTDLCTGNVNAGVKSAAQIIYDVAQACGISPKILLVVLQKEQSLVTDTWPWTNQYTKATGYGCPDSSLPVSVDANRNGCYDSYEGFANQVYYAAQGYKRYQKYPDNYNYRAGRAQPILYHPNTGCGTSDLYIKNQATAGLYIYTPYQPNQAALGNLYGTGDGCSSYGNRNFWRMYNDWFGPSIGPLIRTFDSGTLYYSDGTNKYPVTSMQIAAEYGLNEQDVRFVSQGEIDRLQTGRSFSLVIKSNSDSDTDGGTLYLVSKGKRYAVSSMAQFAGFGFTENEITYVPYDQLLRMPLEGTLSDFVKNTNGFVFKVTNTHKQGIIEGNLYNSLNPGGNITPLSAYSLSRLSTGTLLLDKPQLLKAPSGEIWYARSSGWHYIGSSSIAACLGLDLNNAFAFNSDQSVPGPRLVDATCISKSSANAVSVLDGSAAYPISSSLPSYPSVSMGDEIYQGKQFSSSLDNKVVKASSTGALYVIQNGTKRYLPSMTSFNELGLSESSIISLKTEAASSLPSGPIRYSNRSVIQDTSNGRLYLVGDDSLYFIPSMSIFYAYGLSTAAIIQQPSSYITSMTIVTSLSIFAKTGASYYFIDNGKTYQIPTDIVPAYPQQFINYSAGSLFPPAPNPTATRYIKSSDSPKLYYLDSGIRHHVGSWNTFVSLGGSSSNIVVYSESGISQIPEGTPIN